MRWLVYSLKKQKAASQAESRDRKIVLSIRLLRWQRLPPDKFTLASVLFKELSTKKFFLTKGKKETNRFKSEISIN